MRDGPAGGYALLGKLGSLSHQAYASGGIDVKEWKFTPSMWGTAGTNQPIWLVLLAKRFSSLGRVPTESMLVTLLS